MLEARTSTSTGLPPITQIAFLACRAQYPGGPNRCVSVSSLSARPSPVNRRVGVHDFTFEACSSFTRVTACKVACPPKGGLLFRGFDLASYPTKPLGSYHVLPTTTWMDPPSIGDLRRWGALLTTGWGRDFIRGPGRKGPPCSERRIWAAVSSRRQTTPAPLVSVACGAPPLHVPPFVQPFVLPLIFY